MGLKYSSTLIVLQLYGLSINLRLYRFYYSMQNLWRNVFFFLILVERFCTFNWFFVSVRQEVNQLLFAAAAML